ncbi:DUF177 domain-containing protein [Lentisphaerota bacterium ZTH]|nr:DUF177 domain-containing protein [Lentisphaerota bacterium]WET06345.1 DUF177 domain-containing protein [Lentisphaerota bacterium ZTH]
MIKVSMGLLDHQDIHLEGEEPSSFLEVENSDMIEFHENVKYDLNVSKVSNGVLVNGSISIPYKGVCGRCLKEFKGEAANRKLCLFIEDVTEQELDLSEDLRSELVMQLPVNCICSEDCKGLCHTCGTNLNEETCNCHEKPAEDSPWSALDNLDLK